MTARPIQRPPLAPTPAERLRTLADGCCHTVSARLSAADHPELPVLAHTVDEHGRVLLLLPSGQNSDHGAGAIRIEDGDDLPAVLHLVDVAPVAMAERIRAQGWVGGWLTQVPADERVAAALLLADRTPVGALLDTDTSVLRLEAGELALADRRGEHQVEPEEFTAASVDPLAGVEADVVGHLDACHREELTALARCVGGRYAAHADRARLIGVDRHGLWLRFAPARGAGDANSTVDLRVEFAAPVSDTRGLGRALRTLVHAECGQS